MKGEFGQYGKLNLDGCRIVQTVNVRDSFPGILGVQKLWQLRFYPSQGTVLMCDFGTGFKPPEMVKKPTEVSEFSPPTPFGVGGFYFDIN